MEGWEPSDKHTEPRMNIKIWQTESKENRQNLLRLNLYYSEVDPLLGSDRETNWFPRQRVGETIKELSEKMFSTWSVPRG
jgi:hypothetical protein